MYQKLPYWLTEMLNISKDSKFHDIPEYLTFANMGEEKAFSYFLQQLFNRKMRVSKFKKRKCFPDSPTKLNSNLIDQLDLSVRTTNCLKDLLRKNNNEYSLYKLTFQKLSEIKSFGAKSIFEFLNSIENYEKSNLELNEETSESNREKELAKTKRLLTKISQYESIEHIYKGDPRFPTLNVSISIKEFKKGSSLYYLIEELRDSIINWNYFELQRINEILVDIEKEIIYILNQKADDSLKSLIKLSYKRAKTTNLHAIYNRFGINKNGILTLEECGQSAGITRERIRQIESNIVNIIKSIPGKGKVFMPKFWNVINFINTQNGKNTSSVQKDIYSKSYVSKNTSIDCFILFNELLRGHDLNVEIKKLKNGLRILSSKNLNVGGIFSQMNKLCSRNGISDLKLAYQIVFADISGITYEEMKSIVKSSGMWRNIDNELQWWIPSEFEDISRNRLINIANKILSIAPSVSPDDLRDGFQRLSTFRNSSNDSNSKDETKNIIVPPSNIIYEFFKYCPDYRVSNGLIYYDGLLDYRNELGEVETALVDTILEAGKNIISRADLLRGGVSKGINEASLNAYITYSCVIKHSGLDTHQLVGMSSETIDIFAHQKSISKKGKIRKRVLLSDWYNGYIRIACRVPEFYSTMVIGAPSAFKSQLINKKFKIKNNQNESFGIVGVNAQGSIYGMNTFTELRDASEDDILVMMFDLLEQKVFMSIISYSQYLKMLED